MKKCLCVVLLLVCMCFASGCAKEEIVGQWVYESGGTYLLIYPNGDIFEVSINGMGEYITGVVILEDGGYETFQEWYKDGEKYHWSSPTITNDEHPDGWDRIVHIDGDTMIIGDSVYEWHRLPKRKWLSEKEVYYSTFDKENSAYVQHPLSEIK